MKALSSESQAKPELQQASGEVAVVVALVPFVLLVVVLEVLVVPVQSPAGAVVGDAQRQAIAVAAQEQ